MAASIDPATMVGRWVRIDRGTGRFPHVGVLDRYEPDRTDLCSWGLRTPTSYMIGGPDLVAELLTSDHRRDIERAHRHLERHLAEERALLHEKIAGREPAMAVRRTVTTLEHLQTSLQALDT